MSTMTLHDALGKAREVILMSQTCGHDISCSDPACVAADHDHEGGEDDWGCGHNCSCVPACKGFEPSVCAAAREVRDLVCHIEALLYRPAPPPGDAGNEGKG